MPSTNLGIETTCNTCYQKHTHTHTHELTEMSVCSLSVLKFSAVLSQAACVTWILFLFFPSKYLATVYSLFTYFCHLFTHIPNANNCPILNFEWTVSSIFFYTTYGTWSVLYAKDLNGGVSLRKIEPSCFYLCFAFGLFIAWIQQCLLLIIPSN